MRTLLETQPTEYAQHDLCAGASLRHPSTNLWTLIVVSLSCVFIYLQVFVPVNIPRIATGDQAIYLHHATRMLNGEMIYRDYDHFTLPGTDAFYMTLFRLFGVRAWIPQAMLVILGGSLVWQIILISRKLLSGTVAYIPALLFVALPFSSFLDATHHWYSLTATTAALLILLGGRTSARLASAGALVAIATFFTQSMALLPLGFAFFLVWENQRQGGNRSLVLKKLLSLLAGFIGTFSVCMAYFVWKVGFKQITYYTVIFVVKYYPSDWFNSWRVYLSGRPKLHSWPTLFDAPAFFLVHLIVPFVYVFCLVALAAGRNQNLGEVRNRLMLINIVGLFLVLTSASAPAYYRLYAISPPAFVILMWLIDSSPKVRRTSLRVAWIMVVVMFAARPLMSEIRPKAFLTLPIGRLAFFDPLFYDKCKWMAERTHPGESFFGDHVIAFNLQLRNVGRIPCLRPTDYTRPEEVADAIQKLEQYRVKYVSWYIDLDHDRDLARHPEGNHLAPIRRYLHENYHLATTFSNGDQMWERN